MIEETKQFYNEATIKASKPKILLGDAWLEFANKNIKTNTKTKAKFKADLNKLHKAFLKGLVYENPELDKFIPLENLKVVGKSKFKINNKEYRFFDISAREALFKTNSSEYYKPKEFPTYFYFGRSVDINILYIKKEKK